MCAILVSWHRHCSLGTIPLLSCSVKNILKVCSLPKQSKSDTDMLDHIALHCIIRQCSAYARQPSIPVADCSVLHEQEMNEKDERTRFLQIWMTPDRRGHKPQYGSSKYSTADRHNKLLQILGGTQTMPAWETAASGAGITLHQV